MTHSYQIQADDLQDGKIIELLLEHHERMHQHSPPESIHALDIDAMHACDLRFWSARRNDNVVGCGALKALGADAFEIKSMKVVDSALGTGIGKALLTTLIEKAKSSLGKSLFLETGTHNAFLPARRLYEQFGFTQCGPFSDYKSDPYSVFYQKKIS